MARWLVGSVAARSLLVVASAAGMVSCAGAVESSRYEDTARRMAPIPICIRPYAQQYRGGGVPNLGPGDYWGIVMRNYDPTQGTLDRNAPDCSGRYVLSGQDLGQAEGPRTGLIRATEPDTVFGQAQGGFKIVWLRTHKFVDGTAAGPLALLRPKEQFAEVYGVGLYRGRADKSRFALERLGPDLVVTASDEGCPAARANESCETALTVFLLTGGRLHPGAKVSLDRVQFGTGAPVGVAGMVQYHLTATPLFDETAFRVSERVSVMDGAQRELRRAELERTFVRRNRTDLVPSANSLWAQVIAGTGLTAGTPVPPSGPAAPAGAGRASGGSRAPATSPTTPAIPAAPGLGGPPDLSAPPAGVPSAPRPSGDFPSAGPPSVTPPSVTPPSLAPPKAPSLPSAPSVPKF